MPKSKHRKQPFRTAVQRAARIEAIKQAQDKAREIYDRALPKHQEYPPVLAQFREPQRTIKPAEVKPETYHVGQIVKRAGKTYRVERKGWRRVEVEAERKAA